MEISVAEMDSSIEFIDLHGLRPYEAESDLGFFIDDMFRKKVRVVKVIHGKGEGKLLDMVKEFLAGNELVEYFAMSKNTHELGAVVYAILKV